MFCIPLDIFQALKPLGIGVATGEQCQNRIMFKQFLKSGAMQYCQIDCCRMGGINEVLAVILLARKYNGVFHFLTLLSLLYYHFLPFLSLFFMLYLDLMNFLSTDLSTLTN